MSFKAYTNEKEDFGDPDLDRSNHVDHDRSNHVDHRSVSIGLIGRSPTSIGLTRSTTDLTLISCTGH